MIDWIFICKNGQTVICVIKWQLKSKCYFHPRYTHTHMLTVASVSLSCQQDKLHLKGTERVDYWGRYSWHDTHDIHEMIKQSILLILPAAQQGLVYDQKTLPGSPLATQKTSMFSTQCKSHRPILFILCSNMPSVALLLWKKVTSSRKNTVCFYGQHCTEKQGQKTAWREIQNKCITERKIRKEKLSGPTGCSSWGSWPPGSQTDVHRHTHSKRFVHRGGDDGFPVCICSVTSVWKKSI